MIIIKKKINELNPAVYNPRKDLKPEDKEYQNIKKSIETFGYIDPIIFNKRNNVIIGGHQRFKVLKELGYNEIDCVEVDLEEKDEKALNIALNKISGEWDLEALELLLKDIDEDLKNDLGLSFDELDSLEEELVNSYGDPKDKAGNLAKNFIVPPFSVFDAKAGYWRERKRSWIDLGIKSEEGRDVVCIDNHLMEKTGQKNVLPEASVFDPVLCEVCYTWFNIKNGRILDPFAGGSVRGIVANKLGYDYTGIDLRQEQIDANFKNAKEIGLENINWICDDSLNLDKYANDNEYDLIFSCPPYFDLEVYSDDDRDLSNMDYEEFKITYKKIIDLCCKKLKDDRFAIFVVGDVRDKNGIYRNFIDYTKECFNRNGLGTYNEIILLDNLTTAPLRAPRMFNTSRKVCKVHQNVLVFYKGNPDNIKNIFNKLEFENVEGEFINE